MTEKDIKNIKETKDNKELLDIIKKIIKLENQIDKPDRNGMIEALQDAQSVACNEIVQNIQQSSSFFIASLG